MNLEEIFKQTSPGDVGIVGFPVDHSLSPIMQNAAFQTWWGAFRDRKEKTPTYHKIPTPPGQEEKAYSLAKQHGLRGLNVTVPHKRTFASLVDKLDAFSGKVGSVNTISFLDGCSQGFNTDGDGFGRTLSRDLNWDPMGKKVLLLGSGGTGRVILQNLLDNGATVQLWNRTEKSARELISSSSEYKTKVTLVKAGDELREASLDSHLVVNATSVGLSPEDGMPAPNLEFKPGQVAFDVIYHRHTRFLQEAEAKGASVKGGLGMLVHQGARAFEIWTGAPAPVEIMWSALTQNLKKDSV